MTTKKVRVNGETVEVPEKFTPEIVLERAGIPQSRTLVALGPRPGESKILPKGQLVEDEVEEFADIPVFRYGAEVRGERLARSPLSLQGRRRRQ